ncbi:hypothetical protein CC79DRAFT_451186 [Sarocladium strictum]
MKIGSSCRLQKQSRLRRLSLLACPRRTPSCPRLWRSKRADLAPGNGELFASGHGFHTLMDLTPPRKAVREEQQYRSQHLVRHRDMCKYRNDRRPGAPRTRVKQCGWRSIALSSVPGFSIRPNFRLRYLFVAPHVRIGAAADLTMYQIIMQSQWPTITTTRQ